MSVISNDIQEQIEELLGPLTEVLANFEDSLEQQHLATLGKQYQTLVKQLCAAMQGHPTPGFEHITAWFLENVQLIFTNCDEGIDQSCYGLLMQWPFALCECLEDDTKKTDFISLLKHPDWPHPLNLQLEQAHSGEHCEKAAHSSTAAVADCDDQPQGQEVDQAGNADIDYRETPDTSPLAVIADPLETPDSDSFYSEFFELIYCELLELIPILEETKSVFSTPHSTPYSSHKKFIPYRDTVERLQSAAVMTGIKGIELIVDHLLSNIDEMASQNLSSVDSPNVVISTWPNYLLNYLKDPTDINNCHTLIALFQDETLPRPIPNLDVDIIQRALANPSSTIEESQERQTQASEEDASLSYPADIPTSLYETFLQESPLHIAEISTLIGKITISGHNTEHFRALQNSTHTLKGASATIGINGISSLCHYMEDIVENLFDQAINIDSKTLDMLLQAADCLEATIEYLQGMSAAPSNILQVLQSLLDCSNCNDQQDVVKPTKFSSQTSQALLAETDIDAAANSDEKTTLSQTDPGDKQATVAEKVAPSLRVPTEVVSHLMSSASENFLLNGHMKEQYTQALSQARILSEKGSILQKKLFDLENILDIKGIPIFAASPVTTLPHPDKETHNTPQADPSFDPLELDQYNDLHSNIRQFSETVADIQDLSTLLKNEILGFKSPLQQQDMVNKDIQNQLMSMRMAKVQSIIPRLQRCVRNTCRLTDKTVKLEIVGDDILIDMDVLNAIVDPLMHMLRNAVDHGIEDRHLRSQNGKECDGNIRLSFQRKGNSIVIKCKDDGRGLDYEHITQIGRAKGLLSLTDEPSKDDIAQLLFSPGFSTKNSVSKISGRGVGLDVVYQNIAHIGGNIEIHSEQGKNLSLSIYLPITLLSVNVVIISHAEHTLAIASNQVEQILFPKAGKITSLGKKSTYHYGDNHYPFFSLSQLLPATAATPELGSREKKPALLLRTMDHYSCVCIDKVLECRDIVIKNLSDFLPPIAGIHGATIMADGAIIPILDINELLLTSMHKNPAQQQATISQVSAPVITAPKVLIIDDSISVRRSLQELIGDAGYEARTAQDGMDAINIIEKWMPNIVLSDLEMPGMNGLELTTHLRSNQATQSLPVVMITSRHTQKHHDQAKKAGVNVYLTKPYSETQLLETVEQLLN